MHGGVAKMIEIICQGMHGGVAKKMGCPNDFKVTHSKVGIS